MWLCGYEEALVRSMITQITMGCVLISVCGMAEAKCDYQKLPHYL